MAKRKTKKSLPITKRDKIRKSAPKRIAQPLIVTYVEPDGTPSIQEIYK
jgi:hypothetical protein